LQISPLKLEEKNAGNPGPLGGQKRKIRERDTRLKSGPTSWAKRNVGQLSLNETQGAKPGGMGIIEREKKKGRGTRGLTQGGGSQKATGTTAASWPHRLKDPRTGLRQGTCWGVSDTKKTPGMVGQGNSKRQERQNSFGKRTANRKGEQHNSAKKRQR